MKPFVVITPTMGKAPTLLAGLIKSCRVEEPLCDLVLVWNEPTEPCPHPEAGNLTVLNPGKNLGWLGGNNFGANSIELGKYSAVCFCNDDVTLMEGFFAGLLDAHEAAPLCVISPTFNSDWGDHFIVGKQPRPERGFLTKKAFIPTEIEQERKYLDGTCLIVPTEVIREVGLLDEEFSRFGWGASIDYCYRTRNHPRLFKVKVTGRCALDHAGRVTANNIWGNRYLSEANAEKEEVLKRKYPDIWRELFMRR